MDNHIDTHTLTSHLDNLQVNMLAGAVIEQMLMATTKAGKSPKTPPVTGEQLHHAIHELVRRANNDLEWLIKFIKPSHTGNHAQRSVSEQSEVHSANNAEVEATNIGRTSA